MILQKETSINFLKTNLQNLSISIYRKLREAKYDKEPFVHAIATSERTISRWQQDMKKAEDMISQMPKIPSIIGGYLSLFWSTSNQPSSSGTDNSGITKTVHYQGKEEHSWPSSAPQACPPKFSGIY
jgi:hypothetical protein